MSYRRVGGIVATALATLLWMSCGQVYRPVVLPVATPPPNPANFHAVFGLATNVAANPGTAMQIDVSGDSDIGVADMGLNPTHAASLPNNSRVFVSSAAGSLCPTAGPDTVTAFTPATDSTLATGLGTPDLITYPNAGTSQTVNITSISELGDVVNVTLSAALVNATTGQSIVISNVPIAGYNGCFPINSINSNATALTYINAAMGLASITSGPIGTLELPAFCPYLPDYVATIENTAVFVANYGAESNLNCGLPSTDSVASINTSQSAITNIQYLGANTHPVAMAETQDGLNLYVVNEASNNVVDLSPTDLSILTPTPISVGTTPVWVVARDDSRRIYVLTQGGGQLVPIDTASNAILPSTTNLSVGAGANFILYDPNLGRLYVTNPATSTVYVFSATGGLDPTSSQPNDTPALLKTISFAAGSTPCPNGCSPVSIAAMPDGSRFYVASYQLAPVCPDPNVGSSSPCIVPQLTVFNAASMMVKPVSSAYTLLPPSLSLLTPPQFGATQYAVAQISSCAPATTYTPNSTRFRMFTTAAADSSHVYVSICDAGIVADVDATTSSIATSGSNTPDTLAANIPAPLAACAGAGCGTVASITGFSIANNVVTFHAVNNYVVGEQVSITGLSTQVGRNLNGQTLAVLSTGLSATQFEAVLNPPNTQPDTPLTTDSGTAVPVPALQNPVFLLTGQ